ncbi:MAG TPA: DUF6703 family protein [Streptosporangiaceae bacterium]
MSTNRARQQAGGRARQRRPRPLPPGDTLFSPDASPARTSIEQRSATPLLWLHQLPRWLLPVLAVVLLVTGLAVGGWGGAIALCGLAGVLAWLATLSWPRLSTQGRLLRVAAVAAVLVIAVIRAVS